MDGHTACKMLTCRSTFITSCFTRHKFQPYLLNVQVKDDTPVVTKGIQDIVIRVFVAFTVDNCLTLATQTGRNMQQPR
jgi:hypothetical protein